MRLLNLFMMLSRGKGSTYIRGVIMYMLLILYSRSKDMPNWRILRQDLNAFNEEGCEISFSVLARSCLGDTNRHDVKHLSKLYKLLGMYSEVEDEVEGDIESTANMKSWRKKITSESAEVAATTSFFLARLRQIKHGQLTMYDGTLESYKKKTVADKKLIPFSGAKKELWMSDTSERLEHHINECRRLYITDWGKELSDVWPGLNDPNEDEPEDPLTGVVEEEDSDASHQSTQEHKNEQKHNSPVKRRSMLRAKQLDCASDQDMPHDSDHIDFTKNKPTTGDDSDGAISNASEASWGSWGDVNARAIIAGGAASRRQRRKRNRANDGFPYINDYDPPSD